MTRDNELKIKHLLIHLMDGKNMAEVEYITEGSKKDLDTNVGFFRRLGGRIKSAWTALRG